jgi:hypothetical protein
MQWHFYDLAPLWTCVDNEHVLTLSRVEARENDALFGSHLDMRLSNAVPR